MFSRFLKIVLFLTLCFSVLDTYPRAGGSGGDDDESSYSSSDDSYSSSDDDNDSYDYSSSSDNSSSSSGGKSNPIVNLIIGVFVAIVIVIGLISAALERKKYKDRVNQNNSSNNQAPLVKVLNETFLKANPDFNEQSFKQKVKIAFMQIQQAWQDQKLGKVRKWISDGIYQRFFLQTDMMRKLGQVNKLSNISISNINLIKAEASGAFSSITVLISFSMDDEFICEGMPELNANYKGTKASEYWTFIKKSGGTKGNLYQSNDCPNCSAPLNNEGGEVSKCASCGTITYLGDYDWILVDITQKNDYLKDQNGLTQASATINVLKQEEEFSLQLLEDKAANAFINILVAHATGSADKLYRFATNNVIAAVANTKPYLFNRLYVINVLPASFESTNGIHTIKFRIAYGAQRVSKENGNIHKIDNDLVKKEGYLQLSRKAGIKTTKSKHWSYECGHCGTPYDDTTLDVCKHCQSVINSEEHDWLVSDIKNIV